MQIIRPAGAYESQGSSAEIQLAAAVCTGCSKMTTANPHSSPKGIATPSFSMKNIPANIPFQAKTASLYSERQKGSSYQFNYKEQHP